MKNTYFELRTLEKDLGVKAGTLYSLSNSIDSHYRSAAIPKSDGSKRVLSIPDFTLKHVQNRINEVILFRMNVSIYSKAYSFGDSPLKNALPHLKQKQILKLDIRKYFDHVTYPLIKENVFKEDQFSESNRILLSLLCIYNESLPQGAPTSPAISNILLYDFDNMIGKWCRNQNIIYTRYCDDMTFSGDDLHPNDIIKKVETSLKEYGLFINRKKIQYLHDGQRKKITGVVVNDKPNVSVDYRKRIRQEMYYIRKFGFQEHLQRIQSKDSADHYLRSLLGRINYILSINHSDEFEEYRTTVTSLLDDLLPNYCEDEL